MFDAAKANELLESAMKERAMKARLPKKEKWNLLDELNLKKVERDIKERCKEGYSYFFFKGSVYPRKYYPIRERVADKLRDNGYKVFVVSYNEKVTELKIEW